MGYFHFTDEDWKHADFSHAYTTPEMPYEIVEVTLDKDIVDQINAITPLGGYIVLSQKCSYLIDRGMQAMRESGEI